jgi:hypothetical protein
MPAIRGWLLCLLPCLAACGFHDPDPEQIAREAQARHPGCAMIDAAPGEGDSDTVYIMIGLQCADGATRRFEARYQRSDGRWNYRSESEVDPASRHDGN